MPTLFLETFGKFTEHPELATIDGEEEDLYSVFRARSVLMGWASTCDDHALFWSLEEAELTAGIDTSRIGWVQVGLDVGPDEPVLPPTGPSTGFSPYPKRRRSSEPVRVLPALVHCLNAALSCFGAVELSAVQVTAIDLEFSTRSYNPYPATVLNCFNFTSKSGAETIAAFDQGLLGGDAESPLIASLQHLDFGPFKFGASIAVPEQHMARVPPETPYYPVSRQSDVGVSLTLSEWTPSAVGWVLAYIVDTARVSEADVSNFALRVTRIR